MDVTINEVALNKPGGQWPLVPSVTSLLAKMAKIAAQRALSNFELLERCDQLYASYHEWGRWRRAKDRQAMYQFLHSQIVESLNSALTSLKNLTDRSDCPHKIRLLGQVLYINRFDTKFIASLNNPKGSTQTQRTIVVERLAKYQSQMNRLVSQRILWAVRSALCYDPVIAVSGRFHDVRYHSLVRWEVWRKHKNLYVSHIRETFGHDSHIEAALTGNSPEFVYDIKANLAQLPWPDPPRILNPITTSTINLVNGRIVVRGPYRSQVVQFFKTIRKSRAWVCANVQWDREREQWSMSHNIWSLCVLAMLQEKYPYDHVDQTLVDDLARLSELKQQSCPLPSIAVTDGKFVAVGNNISSTVQPYLDMINANQRSCIDSAIRIANMQLPLDSSFFEHVVQTNGPLIDIERTVLMQPKISINIDQFYQCQRLIEAHATSNSPLIVASEFMPSQQFDQWTSEIARNLSPRQVCATIILYRDLTPTPLVQVAASERSDNAVAYVVTTNGGTTTECVKVHELAPYLKSIGATVVFVQVHLSQIKHICANSIVVSLSNRSAMHQNSMDFEHLWHDPVGTGFCQKLIEVVVGSQDNANTEMVDIDQQLC